MKEKKKHPSYGMVSLSTIHSSSGKNLFGSRIKHDTFIELKIKTAELERDEFHDHYFGRDCIVQVWLSPAQFTGLLTQMNTTGVPCTIDFTREDGYIEKEIKKGNVKSELIDDLKSKFKELEKRIRKLKDEINEDLKGSVKKAGKEKIKFNVLKIHQDINSNLRYLMECQIKKLEEVGIEIIAEAESKVNGMIKQAGLKAILEENKRLEAKKDVKMKRIIKR